ncbi:hypothetical protein BKA80DRAFT_259019, partial [Phyllosticta citrichinensis]
MPPSCNPQQRTDVEDELKARNRIAHACASCHARKIKCDLTARRGPPCSRCEDSELPCNVMIRRRRMIRAVESVSREVV